MKNKKAIQDELKDIAPSLAKLRETGDGFSVPDNYFEFLTESMLEQAKLVPQPTVPKKEEHKQPWYAFLFTPQLLGGLATVCILLGATMFLLDRSSKGGELIDISADEAVAYISNHLDEFETTLFIQDDFLGDINEVDLDDLELDQYLEENIEEIDDAILEELL